MARRRTFGKVQWILQAIYWILKLLLRLIKWLLPK